MKDRSNYEIVENEAELEKLCTDSVELINYARNGRKASKVWK